MSSVFGRGGTPVFIETTMLTARLEPKYPLWPPRQHSFVTVTRVNLQVAPGHVLCCPPVAFNSFGYIIVLSSNRLPLGGIIYLCQTQEWLCGCGHVTGASHRTSQ